jgi:hypothetical protein
MHQVLYSITETSEMVSQGRRLLLSGDEQLLRQLPAGHWIAGTSPYFIAETGGIVTRDKIHVDELPDFVESIAIKTCDEMTIPNIYRDIPENGFAIVIIPANCPIHLTFALKAHTFEQFAARPLVGWVSGVHLDDLGRTTPKVFDGEHRLALENQAVVMHVGLPANKVAELGILNMFEQSVGDIITFPSDGFCATEVCINDKPSNLAEYINEKGLAIRLPLVADYKGTLVNVSFQQVDTAKGEVKFYAPVFKGVQYRHAKRLANYVTEFTRRMPVTNGNVAFSCNCILNFVYSKLEGKRTGDITGPVTFGEIANRLLNQTMAYLTISDRSQGLSSTPDCGE